MNITIRRATAEESPNLAVMVGELLNEIMAVVRVQAFNFNLDETTDRLTDYIRREKYFVFVADGGSAGLAGFVALSESYALYAEGAFGIIPEFYVRPAFRSQKVGAQLLAQAKSFGRSRHWKRLEVTTPPLPQFDKSLAFYERDNRWTQIKNVAVRQGFAPWLITDVERELVMLPFFPSQFTA